MSQQHLLFELGSEELPPKTLLKLSQALLNNIVQGLNNAELSFTASKAYATPRRLAVFIENLATAQPNKTVEKRGPAVAAAFDKDGNPSKAAVSFAASCNTTFEQLGRLKTDKGEWLAFTQSVEGQATAQLIPDIINQSINALPIAKRMRWGSFNTEFVRPVHWAVLLYGDSIIETEILGLTTNNKTRGHRFHAPQEITIDKPENYAELLFNQGKVIADIEQRKTIIRDSANNAAAAVNGIAHIEEDLLEEIAALNEYPVPITGGFDTRFLALPAEVLITTMQTNQKYFPVKNNNGDLLAHFITFSNIESTRPESIQRGNERVVTPRLSDAEFFWNQDRKTTLFERVDSLNSVVFQERLGTVGDKTQRVIKLAGFIAEKLNADIELSQRAALLAKTDLMTSMVGEFGNLQGIMGRYYALVEGENEQVAWALEEQYLPKQAGGITPTRPIGQILAIAEKIDTLVGIFSVGLLPTGDKDPYALRRAALGILRTLIENNLVLDIKALIQYSAGLFTHDFKRVEIEEAVLDFVYERLKGYCLDKGFTSDEFEALGDVLLKLELHFELTSVVQRLQILEENRTSLELKDLKMASKRIRNFLRKSKIQQHSKTLYESFKMSEEINLCKQVFSMSDDIEQLLEQRDYGAVFIRLAQLRPVIDAFFDNVMVLCDDEVLRSDRLSLLNDLNNMFLKFADFSKLQ